MKDLKKNLDITRLQERASKSSIALSGFIGESPKGVIRLFQGSDISQYIDIAESDIDEFDQNSDSGITHLYLKSSAIVDVVSTRKVPASIVVFLDNAPDGGTEKTCLQKRIDNCKKDPLVHDKSTCDNEKYQGTLQLLCDLFGDPAERGGIDRLIQLFATNQVNSIR